MTNKQLIKKLENACVVCRDCGLEYGVYSVGCSSVWEGVCNVCGETKPVTETRDYAYLMTGIRKLIKEDEARTRPFAELTKNFTPERKAKIKEQSAEVAKYMLTQEPTMTNHPITPPPELVSKWANMFESHTDEEVFTEAAQWGSDQELEACCEWLQDPDLNVDTYKLRAARRPKPPSLKEQALESVKRFELGQDELSDLAVIRRAIEALPND